MNVLIIGPNGFVGRHLKARLLHDGHTVVNGDRNYHFIPDLANEEPIDAIINCAGEITRPHFMYANNVALVDKMLRFARDAKIPKVIQIGSSSEYGDISEPRREDMNCVATDLYSATKIAATALCQGFAKQHDLDVCVARPFSLYGPNDTPRKLIPRLLFTEPPDLVKVIREPRHDYVYVSDFIEGLVILLYAPREKTKGDIVNFGSGESVSNEEIVIRMLLVRDQSPYELTDSGHSHDWVADTTKARVKYGWVAKTSLEEGLKKTITLS